MGSIQQRREGMKTVWRNLSARARLGECFGFIDCLAMFYKAGHISREVALDLLHQHASPDEIKEYRRVRNCEILAG